MPRVSRNAQILMNHLRPFPKSRAQRQKKQHPRYHSILPPLLRALYTSVKPGHRLIRTSNLHLSEICIAALAAFCRTFRFCLIDVLPTIRATQDVAYVLEFHGFSLEVPTIEDHLVGTGAAFEAVFADVHAVFGSGVGGGDLSNYEHVAAGGAEEEHFGILSL